MFDKVLMRVYLMHGVTLIVVGITMVAVSIYLSRDIEHSFNGSCKQDDIQVHSRHQNKLGYFALLAFSGLALIAMGVYLSFIWSI